MLNYFQRLVDSRSSKNVFIEFLKSVGISVLLYCRRMLLLLYALQKGLPLYATFDATLELTTGIILVVTTGNKSFTSFWLFEKEINLVYI